jgi:hypothetical protein
LIKDQQIRLRLAALQQQCFFKRRRNQGRMILLTVTCLIGILIGLHFNVLAVVPSTLAVVLVSCADATANAGGFLAVVLTALLSGIGVQGGYMIGLTSRSLLGQRLGRFGTPQSRRV